MNKRARQTKGETVTVEDLRKMVRASIDEDGVGMRYALERWERDFEAEIEKDHGEKVHALESQEVKDAVLAFFQADIRDNLAVYNAKLARIDRKVELAKLQAAMARFDGFFMDDDELELVPEKLGVFTESKDLKKAKYRKVVEFSRSMVEDETVDPTDCPTDLGTEIRAFAEDLQEFVQQSGEDGKSLVLQVTEDLTVAQRELVNESAPKPIRFLAQLAIKAGVAERRNASQHTIGFGNGGKE